MVQLKIYSSKNINISIALNLAKALGCEIKDIIGQKYTD